MSTGTPASDRLARVPENVMDRRRAFGTVIRAKRKALGLSQEKLAQRAGIDRQSMNRYENAQFSPSLDTVWDLADALEMTMDALMLEARMILEPVIPDAPA